MTTARWNQAEVPELPEVETARRHSERALTGKCVVAVGCTLPKLLRDSPISNLDALVGAKLNGTRRRAKILVLDFDSALSLMIHFKLSGQWAIFELGGDRLVAGHPVPDPPGPYPHKATHATFCFDDGTTALFSDVRQFGWLRLMPSGQIADALDAFGFGPEGIEPLDAVALTAIMARRVIPIKSLLLDQSYIAGLGNIYVDEVLFRARVHPSISANAVSPVKRRRIVEQIGPVLGEGIRQGGAKIVHNVAHPIDNFPSVHGRAGQPCFVCGATIEKLRVGGRGTYVCPSCQRRPRVKSTT